MARYRHYDPQQTKMIAVSYGRQLLPGTFEHALSYLIDNEIDLDRFAARFKNDGTGAPAYDPAVLLKVVLFAYSRGITSSRTMARACAENVVFIALACDQQPHFTTLAHFVATLGKEVEAVFRDVLMVCNAQGLIGKQGLLALPAPAGTSHVPVGRVCHRWLQAALERLQGVEWHAR
jgi:transposase